MEQSLKVSEGCHILHTFFRTFNCLKSAYEGTEVYSLCIVQGSKVYIAVFITYVTLYLHMRNGYLYLYHTSWHFLTLSSGG